MVRVEDDAEIPESGAVFTFGKSKFADNVPSKFWIRNDVIKTVACGDEHSIAITGNGRVYVFGSNEWGQLGLTNKKTVTKPYCLKALKHEKVLSAAGGRAHTLITTESGKMYTFGGNSEGQLGVGDTDSRSEPCVISGLDGHVVAVAAGSYHSVLLTADGEVYVFGSNSEGQLGLGDVQKVSSPTKLDLGVQIDVISCGYYHTALVSKVDGKVYTFGEKDAGKLGLLEKQLTDGANRKPQCIFSITERVIAASCGGNHTALVTECGKLYTFGSGLNGQLGLGTMIMETASPSLVGALDNEKIIHVGCGESHTAIVTEQGKIYTCGDGRHGKLGLGDENFSNQFNPVLIKKFNGYFVHQVACGGCHMLVVASKQAVDINETESNEPDVTEASTIRGRRRLNDLQGNQMSAVTQTYGRPLPPLGTNLNDSEATNIKAKKEELNSDQERLDQLQLNTADTLNGNYTELTTNTTIEPEQPPIIENSAELRVSSMETKPPTPTQQPVNKSSVESLKGESEEQLPPAPPTPVPVSGPPQATNKDVDDDGESEESGSSSGHSSSDEEDNENKSNKMECKAVIESEPPPTPPQMSIITKIVTKEMMDQNEPVKEHTKDEAPEETKPVRKKFWTFGRKKSRSDECETLGGRAANDKAKAAKEPPSESTHSPSTHAEKKPSRSATSIFSRSVGISDAQSTANKKQTGSTNKSSTCVIV